MSDTILMIHLIWVYFTHILQDYFTGSGAILWLSSASEATLKDLGKYTTWIHKSWWFKDNLTKHSKTKYIFYGYNVFNNKALISIFGHDICIVGSATHVSMNINKTSLISSHKGISKG